jgi:hypothetical protein
MMPMNPFKSITDIAGNFSGLLQGARGMLEKAGGEGFGQGFKGMVQQALDLNIEGLIQQFDMHLGAGIMRLGLVGDSDRMATVTSFRNYGVSMLEEMTAMRDIINRFITDDASEAIAVIDDMADFVETRAPGTACTESEEALRVEIQRLKKIVRQMNTFLDGEDALLGEEEAPDDSPGGGRSAGPASALPKPAAVRPPAKRYSSTTVAVESTPSGGTIISARETNA